MQIALRREKPSGQTVTIQQDATKTGASSDEEDEGKQPQPQADETNAVFPAPHSFDRPPNVCFLIFLTLKNSLQNHIFFLLYIIQNFNHMRG